MNAIPSPWMTTKECSEYLGISVGSLYHWIGRRGLPASHMGRRLRFHRQYIDQWVESGIDPRVTPRLRMAKVSAR